MVYRPAHTPIPFFTPNVGLYSPPITRQLRRGEIGPGRMVASFAASLAEYCGVRYVLLTTSGTTALFLLARTLFAAQQSEVIVPAYGITATANAFMLAGWSVRTADIGPTGVLTRKSVEAVFTKNTRAVCYVNFSGNTDYNVVELRNFCNEQNLLLIEDAAAGIGHFYEDQHAGSFGDAAILSFSPHKLVTTGQGGAILTNDRNIFEWCRGLMDHGDPDRLGACTSLGGNFRFNDILASMGLEQLKAIERLVSRRQDQIGYLQHQLIHLGSVARIESPDSGPAMHNLLRVENAAEVCKALNDHGILAKRQYRMLHDHPYHKTRVLKGQEFFEQSTMRYLTSIYLPFGLGMRKQQLQLIAGVIAKITGGKTDGGRDGTT